MTKIRVLVVDYDATGSKELQNSLKNLGYLVTGVFERGEKALDSLQESRPDIILTDTRLKGKMDGISFAEQVKNRFDIPVIIHTEDARADTLKLALKADPYAYLIKPVKEVDLDSTINVVINKSRKDSKLKAEKNLFQSIVENRRLQDFIFVRADYRLNKIAFDDITFVEALKDYVVINTLDNSYTTHTTMKEMVRILPPRDFVRIHRSYIVNINKIYSIKYPDLVIEGKMKVLPIGGLYRKELYGRLNLL